jgi:hypothetical protein
MSQPTVFERDPRLARLRGRAGWNASFEPVLAGLRSTLLARPPQQLALLAGADWDPAARVLRLIWLGTEHRITWPQLMVFPGGGEPCPASIQGLFLYYLSLADGSPPADTWVSFRELPDGWLYHQAFQGYTGAVLGRTLGDDMAALARAAELAGGTAIAAGDCSYAFQVLPRVRLAVVYWRGDEEFPADAQVLFDGACSHYLPIDGLAFVGGHLVQRLLERTVPGSSCKSVADQGLPSKGRP